MADFVARDRLGRYYFIAAAFDSEWHESSHSNEVTTVIQPQPPMLKSPVQAALSAPARAVGRDDSLFRDKKQLRIASQRR